MRFFRRLLLGMSKSRHQEAARVFKYRFWYY